MAKKRPGVPTDPVNDLIALGCGIVVVPLGYIFPEGLICHYCGEREATTRDHIVPKASLGVDAWWNLVPCCGTCNRRKADSDPTCSCAFCTRAQFLWGHGYTRKTTRHPSLFSLKSKRLPGNLSRDSYLERYPEPLPKSFPGSS